MANKKNYTLKTAGPDDPIFKEGLHSTAKTKRGIRKSIPSYYQTETIPSEYFKEFN